MDWKSIAHNLPYGQKKRSNCECGDGKTLIINHNAKGYSCYCFRCDYKDFEGKGLQTLAELARIKQLNEEANTLNLKMELPNDFTSDIPLLGRLWLYKAGISEPLWRSYGIGYSKRLERVVLPVRDKDSNLIWYQCRALHKGQKPKYLQPSRGRDTILFRSLSCKYNTQRVVIVEDILSAIRVGAIVPTMSLLGTKITSYQANSIASFKRVCIWLDPDRAGKQGAISIKKTLGLTTQVRILYSERDPKELTNDQIRETVNCD